MLSVPLLPLLVKPLRAYPSSRRCRFFLSHWNELALHKLLRGDTERVGGARGK
jgi:hypothetical protein